MRNIEYILKIKPYFVVLLLLISTFSIVAIGDDEIDNNIIVHYSFETPSVDNVIIDSNFYSRILIPELSNGGNIGYPSLPQKEVFILLPLNSKLIDIEVISGEKVFMGSGFYI